MRLKGRKILELALLLGGMAGIGIWGWSVARERIYQDWNNWLLDRQAGGESASVGQYVKERVAGSARTAAVPRDTVAARTVNNTLLGRLKIPRLKLEAVVREGTGEKTLSLALGHVAGTARPGQNGNVGVAGHRDSLFRGLRDIRLNDRIVFETSDGGLYTYQVSSTKIVKPTEVSVLNAGLYPELTLVTCYPFNYIGSAPDRFIVKARQVGQTMRDPPPTEIAEAGPPPSPSKPPSPPKAPELRYQAQALPAPAHTGARRVAFEVATNHSRQLAPGISMGLTSADSARKTIDGWMWVMPERRTIWLRDHSTREPIIFYGEDGLKREVVIDSVTRNSIHGYLTL